jgi:hypothetical protein
MEFWGFRTFKGIFELGAMHIKLLLAEKENAGFI